MKKAGLNGITRYGGGYENHVTDPLKIKPIRVGGLHLATRMVDRDHPGTYYPHADHLGSLNVLISNSGAEVQRLAYLPFGETSSDVHTLGFLQHCYTSQQLDETDLYFYQTRTACLARVDGLSTAPPSCRLHPGDPESGGETGARVSPLSQHCPAS